jgi:dihydrofolate reductase
LAELDIATFHIKKPKQMRKVILSMMISVDCYTEAVNPEENWHNWDEEMSSYMMNFFNTVDTFIYGRKSYEDMIAYWPIRKDEFARVMNQTPKLVFSRTLDEVTWNSPLIRTEPSGIITLWKQI